jgi:hypothetical protein
MIVLIMNDIVVLRYDGIYALVDIVGLPVKANDISVCR